MSNAMLTLADNLRKIAKELVDESKTSKAFNAYKIFLTRFVNQKGNDRFLTKLLYLVENPRNIVSRNTMLKAMDAIKIENKMDQDDSKKFEEIKKFLDQLKHVLVTYKPKDHPAVKLLEEIFRFGIVNNVAGFKRLLENNRLYKTFNIQEEKRQEQQKEKEQVKETTQQAS